MPSRGRVLRNLGAVMVVATIAIAGCRAGGSNEGADRQAQVESRGAQVMPFDQRRTTHIFRATATGGEQTVVAKDAHDTAQIASIRTHLRDEATRFAAGDFSDPMAIHGMDMPGLDKLRRNPGRVHVLYVPTSRGGQITYTTTERPLLVALHDWFDAQIMDHGTNAHR
jgi:hypothetical protein